ncbi:hypothetical protein AC249_AIPGENE14593, partial [Exaiptasia diaphana]
VISLAQQSTQMLQGVPLDQLQNPYDDSTTKTKKKPVARRR